MSYPGDDLNKTLLVFPAVFIAGIAFLIGQYSATPDNKNEVEFIELDTLDDESIFQYEYSGPFEYKDGDLVPCDETNAEHKLDVDVIVDGRSVHQWIVYFCVFDGTNSSVISESEFRHSYFCKAGGDGGFSGSQRITELAESTVTAKLNWLCTLGGGNFDFESPIIFSLGTTAELNLDNRAKIKWEFK